MGLFRKGVAEHSAGILLRVVEFVRGHLSGWCERLEDYEHELWLRDQERRPGRTDLAPISPPLVEIPQVVRDMVQEGLLQRSFSDGLFPNLACGDSWNGKPMTIGDAIAAIDHLRQDKSVPRDPDLEPGF
jgi:hypothetical protein